eukprot:9410368-Alexandrium_andersonii.AAC.1
MSAAANPAWVAGHPHLRDRSQWGNTIPIWIHGDMARAFVQQKLLILSWMSGIVSGCSWSSRMLFTVIPSDQVEDTRSLQTLLQYFAEGINELQGQPWPSRVAMPRAVRTPTLLCCCLLYTSPSPRD